MLDTLDGYTIKARLFPAVLSAAPILAFVFIGSSWASFGIPEALSIVSVMVLLFAGSDLARRAGRTVEPKLFSTSGGKPRNVLLSYDDHTFDNRTKDRYRTFLSEKIGLVAPGLNDEVTEPAKANEFYDAAYAWLRENTRDRERFALLLSENISYGFRRNLFGLKGFGLTCNAFTVASAISLHFASFDTMKVDSARLGLILLLSVLHLLYFALFVTRKSVCDASNVYAIQLTRSIETLASER